MDLHAILIRAPVNKLAANVVSQRRAATADTPLCREELIYLMDRLDRKSRLLKQVLGITNQSQRKNVHARHNKGVRQFRHAKEPRAFTEYIAIGQNMRRLNRELAELNKARKAANVAAWEARRQLRPWHSDSAPAGGA